MVRLSNQSNQPIPSEPTPPAHREPAPSKPRRAGKRRGWWKAPFLLVFCAAFLASGWFSYKVAAATDKIFTENTTGGSPLLQGKKLKGEEENINILLIGIGGPEHEAPNLADTIQVASINPKTKSATTLSIPRDLYVTVPNSTQKVKINEVHSIGEENGANGGGPGLLKEEVSNILGVPIHYFVRVDFNGFRQLVDSIGGVDIDVKEPLYDPYYPAGESTGYTVVNIKPGLQHMDGETALRYARSRETTSDFDRSRRQQEVMVAVRDKALSANVLTNPGKLSGLVEVLGDRVKTDLSISEAQKLAGIVKDIPASSMVSKVIDNGDSNLLYDSIGPGGAYILLPKAGDYSDIQDFANQLFSGGASVAEGAQIDIQNASGRSGVAQSESDTLTGYGYKIGSITNAATTSPGTIIYDYSGGQKPHTLAYLKKRYGAEVQTRTKPAEGGPDFVIVIGTNYATQSTQKSATSYGATN